MVRIPRQPHQRAAALRSADYVHVIHQGHRDGDSGIPRPSLVDQDVCACVASCFVSVARPGFLERSYYLYPVGATRCLDFLIAVVLQRFAYTAGSTLCFFTISRSAQFVEIQGVCLRVRTCTSWINVCFSAIIGLE